MCLAGPVGETGQVEYEGVIDHANGVDKNTQHSCHDGVLADRALADSGASSSSSLDHDSFVSGDGLVDRTAADVTHNKCGDDDGVGVLTDPEHRRLAAVSSLVTNDDGGGGDDDAS